MYPKNGVACQSARANFAHSRDFVYSLTMISQEKQNSRLNIPNALSVSRIVGVPFLFLLVALEDPAWFVAIFTLLAFTDWLDGFLARRWNQTSVFGSMLDSVGDIALYLSTVYFFIVLFPEYLGPNLPWLGIFMVFFLTAIVVSKVRTGRILFIHTHISRVAAVMLVCTFLSSFYFDTTLLIRLVILTYTLAQAEVIAMFLKYGYVDPDTRTILWLRNRDSRL